MAGIMERRTLRSGRVLPSAQGLKMKLEVQDDIALTGKKRGLAGYGLKRAMTMEDLNVQKNTALDAGPRKVLQPKQEPVASTIPPVTTKEVGPRKPLNIKQEAIDQENRYVPKAPPNYYMHTNEEVPDPDDAATEDEFMVPGYIKQIMCYLRSRESHYAVPENFLRGHSILPTYRKQLLDWIVKVHKRIGAFNETLFLTVSIIDRYTSLTPTLHKSQYQLVGITAIWIASKFEEIYPTHHTVLVKMTDKAYVAQDMLDMEGKMLKALDHDLNKPLHCHFLRRASKVAEASLLHHNLAKMFCEASLLEYDLVSVPASKVAAAALLLAINIVPSAVDWGKKMETYAFYKEENLRGTMTRLALAVSSRHKTQFRAVYDKYSSSKHMNVTDYHGLSSLTFKRIASGKW